jgi:hypothetical protein
MKAKISRDLLKQHIKSVLRESLIEVEETGNGINDTLPDHTRGFMNGSNSDDTDGLNSGQVPEGIDQIALDTSSTNPNKADDPDEGEFETSNNGDLTKLIADIIKSELEKGI